MQFAELPAPKPVRSSMDRLLTLLAALVSGCVLLLLPGIAAFTGYQSTSSIFGHRG